MVLRKDEANALKCSALCNTGGWVEAALGPGGVPTISEETGVGATYIQKYKKIYTY